MIDITNLEEIKKLDPKNVFGSTEMFSNQCQYMIDTYYDVALYSSEYKAIKNIVICGMGGSAYGGHIVLSLFHDQLSVPLVVNSDYHLPGFVNEGTLVILTSYSGSTEEVLSCAKNAKAKGAKITGFSSGGALSELLKSEGYPGFTFNPQFNPSTQPRLGTGYIVMGTIVLLNTLGVISLTKEQLHNSVTIVKSSQESIKQQAQKMAEELIGFIPVVFAAEHLEGNARILRNQFNETAKSFSTFSLLPELNHHLLEGLQNPQDKKLKVIMLDSFLYSDTLKKRVALTKEVVDKNNTEMLTFDAIGQDKMTQMFTTLSFGGYLTVYLAFLYGLDPSLIPWVDYFKEKLKK